MSRVLSAGLIVLTSVFLLVLVILLFPYSRDFDNYSALCAGKVGAGLWEALTHYDPIFTVSCYLVGLLFPEIAVLMVVLLFAGAALYLKVATFLHWRDAFWFILAFYVSRFFLLHEVTQIRAGLATGLLGVFFIALLAGRFAQAAALSILSVLVHLSSLAALPVILLAGRLDKRFLGVAAIILTAAAVALYGVCSVSPNIFNTAAIAIQRTDLLMVLDFRLDYYLQNSSPIAVAPYLNFYLSIKLMFLVVFGVAAAQGKKFPEDVYRVVIIYTIGLIIGMLFGFNEVLSWRLAELFAVFDAVFIGWVVRAMARGEGAGLVLFSFVGLCVVLLFRQSVILS